MKKSILRALLYILLFLFVLCLTEPALAHGDEPRLEISPESLNPGSVLNICGVDFEIEEEISLTLIGSQVEIPLGNVTGDVEGIFLLTITLPVDLVEGTYTIRATTDDHVVATPQITIWGTALIESEEGGRLDEEDDLLAPMPAFPQPIPILSNPSSDSVPAVKAETLVRLSIIPLAVLVALGLIAILAIRLRNRL